MCVPTDWDVIWLELCGNCAFWRSQDTSELRRTGSCASDCKGTLSLAYRGIVSIADGTLAGLPLVQLLSLDGNKLSTLPQDALAGLAGLQGLDLGRNRLSELPAGVFAGLEQLEHLNLRGNELTQLPDSVFEPLARLQTLILQGNQVANLPQSILSLGQLRRLSLDSQAPLCGDDEALCASASESSNFRDSYCVLQGKCV